MEQRQAVEVIADACEALNFSHQHGIIHRDVKPANIMISKTGAVKVMDFGIARALADTGNRLTRTSAVIGTAQYLSPEQASGENVDARSDVYSLGCVLYEMLTGKPPFVGDSPVAVAYQHVRKDPVRPSKRNDAISPELDAVVLKSLAKNPENRYQSAADMRTDLIRVHSGETPDAPKLFSDAERSNLLSTAPSPGGALQPTVQIPARGGSIRRWVIAVAMLAVLAVVVTVGFTVFGARDARVPDVHGQSLDAARTALENAGFTVNVQTKPDSTVGQGEAINTEPDANSMASTGDVVTINVSMGITQETIPDCSKLTYQECKSKLEDAGFEKVVQASKASSPEDKGLVVDISPPANSTSAITNEITVFVGSGPGSAPVPPVANQTADVALQILGASKFTNLVQVTVDGLPPTGQVVGTVPPAGTDAPLDAPIQVQVSRGNQFAMPDLTGKVYTDVVPFLQSFGYLRIPDNGGDVPGPADQRFKVVRQDPPVGTGVNKDGTITLYYGS
jgi:serine/threonine-protein kinase